MGNFGVLSCVTWPPYVGLSHTDPGDGPFAPGEPFGDINYSRAQIMWRTLNDGNIVGNAQIFIPKGTFPYIVYFSGPSREHPMMGPAVKLEHPFVFDRPGSVELDPIQNQDYLQRICQ